MTSRIAPMAAAALALLTLSAAWADGGRMLPADTPKAYTQECASCHTAYPPGMLPRASWSRIMTGLDKHYGSDAALDAATLKHLDAWLRANAGTYKRVREEPPDDRITRSAWFERKHRNVDAATRRLPSVKSAANCTACHAGADRGIYDDDDMRVPEGLSWKQRWTWGD